MISGWTDQQQALRTQYAQFGREQVPPSGHTFAQDAWQQLAATDFWRLALPQSLGGLGGNLWDFAAALEGLASTTSDSGFLLTCVAQVGVLQGLAALGTPAQQDRYLAPLLQGQLSATAIAEPQSGTDVPNVLTSATPTETGYTLTGHKWHIAHGNTARVTLVVARQADTEGLTCYWVENNAPGVVPSAPFATLGIRGLPIASQEFKQVSLPPEARFGSPGKGLAALGSVVGLPRIFYGLVAAQLLLAALPPVWHHLAGRQSFGKPIVEHQQVQAKLTQVKQIAEQARWTAYGALHSAQSGDREAILMGSVAKLTGAEALVQGSQTLLSLLSSHGYQADHPVAQLAQDALGIMSVGGTEETHRINIFNQMKRLYRSAP